MLSENVKLICLACERNYRTKVTLAGVHNFDLKISRNLRGYS